MEELLDAPFFLDDLDVGRQFVSARHRLDAEQIVAFARQFDPQVFHLDPEGAKTGFFGGLAASGWHTAAITMRLLVGEGAIFAGGIVGAGAEINWPSATRPGDVLRVVSEVVDINPFRSRPASGMVTLRSRTLNQRDEVRQVMLAKLVVPRRQPS